MPVLNFPRSLLSYQRPRRSNFKSNRVAVTGSLMCDHRAIHDVYFVDQLNCLVLSKLVCVQKEAPQSTPNGTHDGVKHSTSLHNYFFDASA
mmetsp:Transcript_74545/g.209237  ORF Transcript_74545/g.209237 Transcript_74545/m.209237 type:complete len:91 (+) Transcript_74545:539-811(+)